MAWTSAAGVYTLTLDQTADVMCIAAIYCNEGNSDSIEFRFYNDTDAEAGSSTGVYDFSESGAATVVKKTFLVFWVFKDVTAGSKNFRLQYQSPSGAVPSTRSIVVFALY